MARSSEARIALRSYTSEQDFIADKDSDALSYLYQARQTTGVSERIRTLLSASAYKSEDEDFDDPYYVSFDGVSLELGEPVVIEGVDRSRGVRIAYGSYDAAMLHVDYLDGPEHARKQLGRLATYASTRSAVTETPYILGVSYREMTRLGEALGMRAMDIDALDSNYLAEIKAMHAVCFADTQRARQFVPAAVYLPTEEFIGRFSE